MHTQILQWAGYNNIASTYIGQHTFYTKAVGEWSGGTCKICMSAKTTAKSFRHGIGKKTINVEQRKFTTVLLCLESLKRKRKNSLLIAKGRFHDHLSNQRERTRKKFKMPFV